MSLCPDGAWPYSVRRPVPAARRRPLNPQRTVCTSPGSGQVTSAAIETYEKDYYTEEGLKAFVEENLAAFNQDAASLAGDGEKAPAVLNACTLADGTASLLIDFSSPAAYMEFMAAYPDEESGVQVKALSILSMEEAY